MRLVVMLKLLVVCGLMLILVEIWVLLGSFIFSCWLVIFSVLMK